MLQEHRTHRAEILRGKPVHLLLGDTQQLVDAAVLLLLADHMADFQRFGARALGVGEDVEACDGERADEITAALKLLLRLAAGAGYDVDADEGVGHQGADALYLVAEKGGIVVAVHEAEHGVGSALQRYVEMRHEAARGGAKFYDLVGEQVGLDRGDAVALYPLHAVEFADEVGERFGAPDQRYCAVGGAAFDSFAEIADIHPCDHYLFAPLGGCGACLTDNLGHCGTAAASAGLGDGAVGAIAVAAVLHLEEKAGAVAARA